MEIELLYLLAASLAIGLLIGLERGWQAREAKEGARIAGLRTYALIGLLGGVTGLITKQFGAIVLGMVFLGFSALITYSYGINIKHKEDVGITSLVAALLTFLLGAMATLGFVAESASVAVVTALLLRLKPVLHGWIEKLERKELLAALELLLISVVLLSILPNQGYGYWQAFNPFEIWWMVVLVALISFIGYFAIKIAGPSKGIFFTALFAGFVSSTILTFHFSKLAKQKPALQDLLSMGVLIACGMMFFRLLLFVLILNPLLFTQIVVPISVMGGWIMFFSGIVWYMSSRQKLPPQSSIIKNPLELKSALIFGGLLSLVTILVKGVSATVGDPGIYVVSAISGFVDVDAIILPLSRLSQQVISSDTITYGLFIAASSNTLLKASLACILGGKEMFFKATVPLLSAIVIGLSVMAFYP